MGRRSPSASIDERPWVCALPRIEAGPRRGGITGVSRARLWVAAPNGSVAAETACLVRIMTPGGEPLDVPIEAWRTDGDVLLLNGDRDGWSASATWEQRSEEPDFLEVELEVGWSGEATVEAGLRLPFRLPEAPDPRWLIPGAFYGENRLLACPRPYPRHDPTASGRGDALISDSWSFRSDRAALAAVFATSRSATVGLATDEETILGQSGLGFEGRGDDAWIWLDMPYREEPVRYVGRDEPEPAARCYAHWSPRARQRLRFQLSIADAGAHAYRPFVRHLYSVRRDRHPLRPWVSVQRAADLAAEGLTRWHFRRLTRGAESVAILAETAGFDREVGDGRVGSVDRENMHVAWVSGTPWAAALLRYGRRHSAAAAVEAGAAVLDTISGAISPAGTFWGEWRADRGWGGGWNPSGWVHARTVAEASLFMLRAIADERVAGHAHPAWENAARSSLNFAAARQRDDGNLGLYYDPLSGEVRDWRSAAGLMWIPALLLGADLLDEPHLRDAATRAGGHYARYATDAFVHGAVEDVPLGPSSEDGYAAVLAYVALDRAAPDGGWLDLARMAADWTMTFRYAYNVPFSSHTLLGAYDFRTRGADQASPCNQHLHAYGLICLPEMVELWRRTKDAYYLERSRDNLSCFLQFVAREDGDFNARRGMVSERYYQTDCFGPVGSLLTLSHAWSVGVLLHASLYAATEPELTAGLTPVGERP